jgi:uncharacterized protein involved in exopolysaccharide biosynthesis
LNAALGQLGGLAAIAGLAGPSSSTQTEEALAVLQSREFTEAFIHDEQLLPVLFSRSWDSQAGKWRVPSEREPTLAQAFKYFDSRIRSVSRDKTTGLIAVQIEWRDPASAAEWANKLVAKLNAEMRSRAIDSTNASVGYLERELAATSAIETRQSINRLLETQINQRMLANVTEQYAFRVVDRAMRPDIKDVIWPNKVLLLMLGPVVGLIVGAVYAFAAAAWRAGP